MWFFKVILLSIITISNVLCNVIIPWVVVAPSFNNTLDAYYVRELAESSFGTSKSRKYSEVLYVQYNFVYNMPFVGQQNPPSICRLPTFTNDVQLLPNYEKVDIKSELFATTPLEFYKTPKYFIPEDVKNIMPGFEVLNDENIKDSSIDYVLKKDVIVEDVKLTDEALLIREELVAGRMPVIYEPIRRRDTNVEEIEVVKENVLITNGPLTREEPFNVEEYNYEGSDQILSPTTELVHIENLSSSPLIKDWTLSAELLLISGVDINNLSDQSPVHKDQQRFRFRSKSKCPTYLQTNRVAELSSPNSKESPNADINNKESPNADNYRKYYVIPQSPVEEPLSLGKDNFFVHNGDEVDQVLIKEKEFIIEEPIVAKEAQLLYNPSLPNVPTYSDSNMSPLKFTSSQLNCIVGLFYWVKSSEQMISLTLLDRFMAIDKFYSLRQLLITNLKTINTVFKDSSRSDYTPNFDFVLNPLIESPYPVPSNTNVASVYLEIYKSGLQQLLNLLSYYKSIETLYFPESCIYYNMELARSSYKSTLEEILYAYQTRLNLITRSLSKLNVSYSDKILRIQQNPWNSE